MKHVSGDIHNDQRQKMKKPLIKCLVEANVNLSYQMRDDLLRGRLMQFGQSLDKAWGLKRQFSEKISSPYFDEIYFGAKQNGAIGGKLLGAGGGGFFMFFTPPHQKHKLMKHLESQKLKIWPFRFELNGLEAWTARELGNDLDC